MNLEFKPTTLAERAMTVKLTQSRPSTSSRNANGEAILTDSLGDDANSVTTRLFRDPSNPCRQLLNLQGEEYRSHIMHSWPYEQRGARLVPAGINGMYTQRQAEVQTRIQAELVRLIPDALAYSMWVDMDIARRLAPRHRMDPAKAAVMAPITAAEYPSFDEFRNSLKSRYIWGMLPSTRHPLFDNPAEELRDIQDHIRSSIEDNETVIRQQIVDDTRERIGQPLVKLLGILKNPIGSTRTDPQTGKVTKLGIFRDSAVENITESVALCRAMAMGDPDILQMCDEVTAVFDGLDPAVGGIKAGVATRLREAPGIRAEAVRRLDKVASMMGFMAPQGENE